MKTTTKLKWMSAVAFAVFAVGAGGALAYYQTTARGNAPSSIGDIAQLVISPGTASPTLFPGGSGDVALTVTNPNRVAVRIGSLSLDTSHGAGGFAVDAAHGGCASPALAFTQQDNGGSGWLVPPHAGGVDGQLQLDLSDAVAMGLGADDACQGATFTVYLAAAS
jgi:hypothetical protein